MKLNLISCIISTTFFVFASPAMAAKNFRGRPDDRPVGVGRPEDRPGGGVGRPEDRPVGVGRPEDRPVGVGRPEDRPGGVGRPENRPGGVGRPDGLPNVMLNITCMAESDIYEPCGLPPWKERHFGDNDEEDGDLEAIYVCRQKQIPGTGLVKMRPVCIAAGYGREGDVCGCCGETCPAPCGCPCEIEREDEDGNIIVKEGVKVFLEDDIDWTCVPKFVSAKLTYGDEPAGTCVEICEED